MEGKGPDENEIIIEQRRRESEEREIAQASQVDTGEIFHDLERDFKKYDRKFLKWVVWPSLKEILQYSYLSKIVHDPSYLTASSAHGQPYLELNQEQYRIELEKAKDENNFPFPDYFIVSHNGKPVRLVNLGEKHLLSFKDRHFQLFFTLKLSLIQLWQVPDFLGYQLDKNYDGNKELLRERLNDILLFYPQILAEQKPVIEAYISKLASAQSDMKAEDILNQTLPAYGESNEQREEGQDTDTEAPATGGEEDGETDIKKPTLYQRFLPLYYLLDYLQISKHADKTQMASFMRFILQEETGNKKIGNTNLYRYMKNPVRNGEKSLLADLISVRTLFESLAFQPIIDLINKEIKGLNDDK